MKRFSVGADLGETNLRIAAVDKSGRVLEKLLLAACPQQNEAEIRRNQFSWKSFFQWVTAFGIVLILEIGLSSSPLFAACVESVEPESVSVGAAGGIVNAVQVQKEDLATFPDSCDTQDANSIIVIDVPWITLPPQDFVFTTEFSGAFVIFRTPFFVAVEPNNSPNSRQGSVSLVLGSIRLSTLTITQGGFSGDLSNCAYSLSHSRQVFSSSGGNGKVGVSTAPGCSWTAAGNDFFITIPAGASGTGSGTVTYDVATNGALEGRLGTITIAGLTFVVAQSGTAPLFLLLPSPLAFTTREGAAPPGERLISIFTNTPELAFTASAVSVGDWLSVIPPDGTAPSSLVAAVDPGGLAPGSYQGAVSVTIPDASPPLQTVAVTLTVEAAGAANVVVRPTNLLFPFVLGSAPAQKQIAILNRGGASLDFQATVTTFSGGNWLTVAPVSGTATLAAPVGVTVTADPRGLLAGIYRGRVTVSSITTSQSLDIPVTMATSGISQVMRLSQRGMTFRAIAGGVALPPPRRFRVLNIGSGALNWTASASTLSGDDWLSVNPASGSADAASGNIPRVEVSVNPAGLASGQYYGQVQVFSQEAANSPQVIATVLNVLPEGSEPGTIVQPSGLIFTGVAGGSAPDSQLITLTNITDTPKTFTVGRFTPDGSNWFTPTPAAGTVAPNQPVEISIQPVIDGLTARVRQGVLTIAFNNGTVRTVEMLLVLADTGSAMQRVPPIARLEGCAPGELHPVFTLLGNQFTVSAAWPVPIETLVVDDCGDPVTAGSVLLTFSNGDPLLPLQSLQDGRWSGTWQARNTGVPEVTITVTAAIPGTELQGTTQIVGGLEANPTIPQVGEGAVVSAASFAPQVPVSPGNLISIFGVEMSEGTGSAGALPLPTQIGDTKVVLGGQTLPLLFASAGQINAQVPYGIAANTEHQLVVQRGNSFTVPEPVTVAAAQPAIFTLDQSGTGQGLVFAATEAGLVLAEPATPAKAGDVVVIWCAGLGEVDQPVMAGEGAPSSPPAITADPVTVTIGGINATVQFAGLAPGFTGLYQVNAVVPEGVQSGDDVAVVLTVAGQSSPPVTVALQRQ